MELEKVKNRGFSKLKLIVWLCLAVLFCGGVYFAWGWGRIEFHAQRLGASDREVALASELALLTLGEPGRDVLYDFLLNKRNIKLPPLSLESGGFVSGPGSEWNAHYEGTITLDDINEGDTFEVQARVHDESGLTNWQYSSSYWYTLDDVDCD